ncbi:MAG: cytochrome c [Pseudomonadota bacterium]
MIRALLTALLLSTTWLGHAYADEALFNANCSSCHGQYTPVEILRGPGGDLRPKTISYLAFQQTLRNPPARMSSFSEATISNDQACSLFVYLRSQGMSGSMSGCELAEDPPPNPVPADTETPEAPTEPEEDVPFDPLALPVDRVRLLKCDLGGSWNLVGNGSASPRPLAKFSIVRNAERNEAGAFDEGRPSAQNWWLEVPVRACDWVGLEGDSKPNGFSGELIRMKITTGEPPFRGLYRWDLNNYFELTSRDNLGRNIRPQRTPDNPRIEFSDHGRMVDLDQFETFFLSLRDETKHTYFAVEADPERISQGNGIEAYIVVGAEQVDKP